MREKKWRERRERNTVGEVKGIKSPIGSRREDRKRGKGQQAKLTPKQEKNEERKREGRKREEGKEERERRRSKEASGAEEDAKK